MRRRVRDTSKVRDVILTHGCGEESLLYRPMEVFRRAWERDSSHLDRQTRFTRRLEVERGSVSGGDVYLRESQLGSGVGNLVTANAGV